MHFLDVLEYCLFTLLCNLEISSTAVALTVGVLQQCRGDVPARPICVANSTCAAPNINVTCNHNYRVANSTCAATDITVTCNHNYQYVLPTPPVQHPTSL